MRQCPECKNYAVDLDSYFQRPRCYNCGWLPSEFKVSTSDQAFEPCNHCWGYSELRDSDDQCEKCNGKGKVFNSLGREVAEIVREIMKREGVI